MISWTNVFALLTGDELLELDRHAGLAGDTHLVRDEARSVLLQAIERAVSEAGASEVDPYEFPWGDVGDHLRLRLSERFGDEVSERFMSWAQLVVSTAPNADLYLYQNSLVELRDRFLETGETSGLEQVIAHILADYDRYFRDPVRDALEKLEACKARGLREESLVSRVSEWAYDHPGGLDIWVTWEVVFEKYHFQQFWSRCRELRDPATLRVVEKRTEECNSFTIWVHKRQLAPAASLVMFEGLLVFAPRI